MKQKILAIIPARGGSKRLPHKNYLPLLGKPLIGWTIEQAQKSKLIDRLIVNTDDKMIASVARGYNAEVPFIRDKELAQSESSIYDVIFDTLDKLPGYDMVVLLEPTSPLRKDDDIDKAIQLFLDNQDKAESLVSVGKIVLEDPQLAMYVGIDNFIKKLRVKVNKGDSHFFPYGVIYISKADALRKNKSFYQERTIPYFIERWQNYEINDMCDFLCVEAIMKGICQKT